MKKAEDFIENWLDNLAIFYHGKHIYYLNKDNKCVMEDDGEEYIIRYNSFWAELKDIYNLDDITIKSLLKKYLKEYIDDKPITYLIGYSFYWIEDIFKERLNESNS